MPVQPPYTADAIQIANADAPAGDRLIEASLVDGSLRFTDPRVPGGVDLTALAGLQQAQNVIVVSPTGIGASKTEDGAPITTLQGGLDAVPDSADENNPWLVLLAPGIYIENVLWTKDAVEVRGLSRRGVVLRGVSSQSNIRILRGVFTVPQRGKLSNLTVEHTDVNACVELSSATFAQGSLTFVVAPSVIPGDTFEVGGVTFAAVAAGTLPGALEFELGATPDETAQNAAAAISDPVNGLVGTVLATVSGPVVTIRAMDPGIGGNAITLNTSVPLAIVLSGPNLTGGVDSEPNSPVAAQTFTVEGCDLVAALAPGHQVLAQNVNYVDLKDCDFEGSAVGTFVEAVQCSRLRASEVKRGQAFLYSFDPGAVNPPALVGLGCDLENVDLVDAQISLEGATVASGKRCDISTFAVTGSQEATFAYSNLGSVNLGGTTDLTLIRCERQAVTSTLTSTLSENTYQGSAVFPNVDFVSVSFEAAQPDLNYRVLLDSELEPGAITDIPFVRNRTVTGFEVAFPGATAQTTTVRYVVERNP